MKRKKWRVEARVIAEVEFLDPLSHDEAEESIYEELQAAVEGCLARDAVVTIDILKPAGTSRKKTP